MKKTIIAGIILVVSIMMTGCITIEIKAPDSSDTGSSISENAVSDSLKDKSQKESSSNADTSIQQETPIQNETLREFTSVRIDVMAADINIVTGDKWDLTYNLSEKEPIKKIGVEGNTLFVKTSFDPKKLFDSNDEWFVTVTVPEDTSLIEVDLNTISGDISVNGINCNNAEMSSTSGTVDAQRVTAREIEIESASGAVTAQEISADSMDAETVSGNILAEGVFGEIDASATTGNIKVSGTINIEGSIESTSGNVELTTEDAVSVYATSFGNIMMNGQEKKSPLRIHKGVPVEIESASGNITVQTGK